MGKGLKPSWTSIFGIVIQLFFASVLATSEIAFRKDGMDPNYASLLKECKKIKLPDGTMIQTVPKLLQTPLVTACSTWKSKYGPPLTQAVCRFPDCLSNPCQYGSCEETLQGYQCLCFPGFHGKHCAETSTAPTDPMTITPSESTLPGTSGTSTSGSPMTTESTVATDSTSVTPSGSTLQSTFPVSTSGPATTAASTAPTYAMTITPSDSTLQATSPASTSNPTTSTASSASTDATTVTSSDSTQPETSPTWTSGPPTTTKTTGSSTPTDATTITPSDSTLPEASPTSTSGPPMTTGSSAKVFITDPGANAIFVSEMGDTLHFTSIPSTSGPGYIAYDPTEKHIYWSDWIAQSVYRSNLDGEDRGQVTAAGSYYTYGIAIAERTRILYIAYRYAHKVTSMSIERGSPLPGTETDFVNQGINWPRALVIDEEEGFLYISRNYGIVRALLNATNDIEEIYHNEDLTALSGLSIDLTRHPRRIFFSDYIKKRTFYKELSTSTAVELTEYTHNPYQEALRDVKYFKGTLYWVKSNDPKGIGIMTNYDRTNRSYRVQEISQFQEPRRMLIIT